MRNAKIILISFIILFFSSLVNNYSQTENLLLWNKLGSQTEIENSEYGVDGTIIGNDITYGPVKFNKGATRNVASSSMVNFANIQIQLDKGCIEFWSKMTEAPLTATSHVDWFSESTWTMPQIVFQWDKNYNWGDVLFIYSSGGLYKYIRFWQWNAFDIGWTAAGDIIHLAVVWDMDLSYDDCIKLYANGVRVSGSGWIKVAGSRAVLKSSVTNNLAILTMHDLPDIDRLPNCTMDNIKVWNYAKTDFSDRFLEALNVESAFEDLDDTIVDLELSQGTENSLTSKLDNALKSLEKDNDGAAINQLKAFINQVEAKRGKELSDEEADYLIATAETIIDEIEVTLEKRADNSTVKTDNITPTKYSLAQNYPNPFNPTTTIGYELPDDGHVVLNIYDVLGNEVAQLENGYKSAGHYSNSFNASDLTSGIYFYRIRTSKFVDFKKMLLIK